jgi:hypothetical protein
MVGDVWSAMFMTHWTPNSKPAQVGVSKYED